MIFNNCIFNIEVQRHSISPIVEFLNNFLYLELVS